MYLRSLLKKLWQNNKPTICPDQKLEGEDCADGPRVGKEKAGDRVVSRLKISISVTYCDPHALETEEIKTNTVADTIVPHNGSTT